MTIKKRAAEHFNANGNDALQLERLSAAYLALEALIFSRDAEDHAVILQRRNEKSTSFRLFVQRLKTCNQI
jgi:hypothetical protein